MAKRYRGRQPQRGQRTMAETRFIDAAEVALEEERVAQAKRNVFEILSAAKVAQQSRIANRYNRDYVR